MTSIGLGLIGLGLRQRGGASLTPTFVAWINSADYAAGAYPFLGASGNYAYLGCNLNFNIFDPSTMTGVATLNNNTIFNGLHSCTVNDAETWAFGVMEGGASIASIDITNKAAPSISHNFKGPTPGTSLAGGNFAELDEALNLLVVACFTRRSVAFIDVTNPAAMTWISEFRGVTPGTTLANCRKVSLDRVNKICYFCCDTNGAGVHRVGALDYSTPASPVELWSLATNDLTQTRGVLWDATRNILWASSTGGTDPGGDSTVSNHGALVALEVDPMNLSVAPTEVAIYRSQGAAFNSATSLNAPRSVAFVSAAGRDYAVSPGESSDNFLVLDVTDVLSGTITLVSYKQDRSIIDGPLGIFIDADGYAYVQSFNSASTARGISKWNLHLPT